MFNKNELEIMVSLLVEDIEQLADERHLTSTRKLVSQRMTLINKLQRLIIRRFEDHYVSFYHHHNKDKCLCRISVDNLTDDEIFNTCDLLAHDFFVNPSMIEIKIEK